MKIIEFSGFPAFINAQGKSKTIFDPVRRKSVAATPEEFVRQFMLRYLIREKQFPRALIGVERALTVNKMQKRCDIVVFKDSIPMLLVECKAPAIRINQDVFDQVARYNLALKVPYLLVTNGELSLCCKLNFTDGSFHFLDALPDFTNL